MKPLQSHEIRQKFLDFFQKNEHHLIKGASLIPKNDPTLLFINAGMAAIKPFFTGTEKPPSPRLANVQPCIRTKDIDDVGDRHHLTLFEMLGSWSIGDYYKEKAVELAYDLLVNHLGFDTDKLIASVFAGDEKLGIPPDHTSAKAWEAVGFSKERIVYLPKEDNFWGPAGEVGPCGPCTEVFFDTGEEFGPEYKPGKEFDSVGRYIEIWNAGVFMEFNKTNSGEFLPLPFKSVDTGSGLERMAMVMQGKSSVYETDLFAPVIESIQANTKDLDVATTRMLADHIRSAAFLLCEGVAPSNEGKGYIPRRLLRKCVGALKANKIPLNKLVEWSRLSIENLKDHYPVVSTNIAAVEAKVQKELDDFVPVLDAGLKVLDKKIAANKGKTISGSDIFEAVATHGLPIEVVKRYVEDQGFTADTEGFREKFEKHQAVSRGGGKSAGKSGGVFAEVQSAIQSKGLSDTKFSGYEQIQDKGNVLLCLNDEAKPCEDNCTYLITDQTPFYGEGGGQVGDSGQVIVGGQTGHVENTLKAGSVHVHILSSPIKAKKGDVAELMVDGSRRRLSRRNHSATHLLHSALRQVLGEHVEQKGSHVDTSRLRFDFKHPQAMTAQEKEKVEELVNRWIWDNYKTGVKTQSYDAAIEGGAIGLFGEKYTADVRVVRFGKESAELCGGTHVESTGEIGSFILSSEGSVARGVRRIEAITSLRAYEFQRDQRALVTELATQLKTKPENISATIANLKKKASTAKPASAGDLYSSFRKSKDFDFRGHKIVLGIADLDPKSLKNLADQLLVKEDQTSAVCLLATDEKDKSSYRLLSCVKKGIKDISAKALVSPALEELGGRGGGKDAFAQGGAKSELAADAVLSVWSKVIESYVQA